MMFLRLAEHSGKNKSIHSKPKYQATGTQTGTANK
jgi:hypothetical protein